MKLFAHRGAAGRGADENSLEAIRRALAFGVDGIEVDIRRSRDDEAVLVHDVDLRRIAGDVRQVENLTLQELQDVSLRQGGRVLSLDEFTGNVPVPITLNLEVKDTKAVDPLLRKLKTSTSLRQRVVLSSFAQEVIERVAHEVPDVRCVLLMRAWPVRFAFFTGWAKEHRLYGIGLGSAQWSTRRVEKVHEAGLQAVAWEEFGAQSTRRRADRLRKIGIDVAIVNKPRVYLLS
jgi:glycerophosphoryl diester phosphodiesterase